MFSPRRLWETFSGDGKPLVKNFSKKIIYAMFLIQAVIEK